MPGAIPPCCSLEVISAPTMRGHPASLVLAYKELAQALGAEPQLLVVVLQARGGRAATSSRQTGSRCSSRTMRRKSRVGLSTPRSIRAPTGSARYAAPTADRLPLRKRHAPPDTAQSRADG